MQCEDILFGDVIVETCIEVAIVAKVLCGNIMGSRRLVEAVVC
jgi:hypothetical protein